ncbi:MAG: AMP phosphotransferase [Alphaproteobacteria bacterium]
MDREKYDRELKAAQNSLADLQRDYILGGHRGIIVLEGADAAGKGGLIRRIAWTVDPRTMKVWPISAPSARESRQHWLQRFWEKMPETGQIAIFDRSWYGRVLVERVEGYASEEEWMRAYREIREFEQQLLAEKFRIVKLCLQITKETQIERFRERFENPQKRWKLTAEDIRNREKWDDYQVAFDDMIRETDYDGAPWHRIDANSKKSSRIEGLKSIVKTLRKDIKPVTRDLPPEVSAFFAGLSST